MARDLCFAILPGTDDTVIGIKKGERGYYTTQGMTPADVATFNKKLGVSPAQREAMLAGSLFGFSAPGADPACYANKKLEA